MKTKKLSHGSDNGASTSTVSTDVRLERIANALEHVTSLYDTKIDRILGVLEVLKDSNDAHSVEIKSMRESSLCELQGVRRVLEGLARAQQTNVERLDELEGLKERVAKLEAALLNVGEQLERVASGQNTSTSSSERNPGAGTAFCIFAIPETEALQRGNLQPLVNAIQQIMGSDALIRRATFLGKPQQGKDGGVLYGVKIRMVRQRDVHVALTMRADIEQVIGGHVVEELTPVEIEARRRRVKLCRELRNCGLWAKLDGLQIWVKDISRGQPWATVDEQLAQDMIELRSHA